MEYFIEQDRKIKFLETQVKILKEKKEKLKKELQEKLRELDDLRKFIQNAKNGKKKNLSYFLTKLMR